MPRDFVNLDQNKENASTKKTCVFENQYPQRMNSIVLKATIRTDSSQNCDSCTDRIFETASCSNRLMQMMLTANT
ncbi:hypothetical protein ACTXT7_013405 [Hymenolepis weldensis]